MILTAFYMLFLAPALPQEEVRPARPRTRAEAPLAQPPRERIRQQDPPTGATCPNCGKPLAQRPRDGAAPGADAFRPGAAGPGRSDAPRLQGRGGPPGPATGAPCQPQMRQRFLMMRHRFMHLRMQRMQHMQEQGPGPGPGQGPAIRERRRDPASHGGEAAPTGLDA